MKSMPTQINDVFKSHIKSNDNIGEAMDKHFAHISEKGDKIYNLTKKCAKWLLHNCQHEVPTDAAGVYHFGKALEGDGIKTCWPDHPIVIDCTNNIILSGAKRLFGLALCEAHGTYMPMDFTHPVENNI